MMTTIRPPGRVCARRAPPAAANAEAGFTYLVLMITVAIMGVALAALGGAWHAQARREKERQLLFAGNQIRAAIIAYYEHAPAQGPRFPAALDDLLKDPRVPGTQRYLRRIYPDPVSGSADWGLVRGAAGELVGVHSKSQQEPLKQGGFRRANRSFEGMAKYSDWVFMFVPGQYAARLPARTE